MNSYIVTYDLVGTDESSSDYKRLIEKIKAYPNWAKLQYSAWILRSEKSAKTIRDELLAHMDSNDRLFVAKLTGEAAWHNSICKNDWLMSNLSPD